jgi:predicted lipid-binding transport protein (Tim44 family)
VKKFSLFILIALGLCLMRPPEMADAKRLGGGGSFGSRPSYSQKYSKPTAPSTPSAQPSAPSSPLGGRGMFGGLLGGMLMGGLLGSLFFGGGFHGPSLLDVVLIGGGLFLLFRFLRSRQPATYPASGPASATRPTTPNAVWDTLRASNPSTPPPPPGPRIPTGFDAEDFLAGAKAAYTRMQAAWDSRDLTDLRQFTSDEVYREIQAQAAADPKPGTTEILLLEARVLEARTIGNQTVATVLFDAMLREEAGADRAEQIREAWHFSRYETDGNTHWVVEGIQQLET